MFIETYIKMDFMRAKRNQSPLDIKIWMWVLYSKKELKM